MSTLLVGLGGTGCQVLYKLAKRIEENEKLKERLEKKGSKEFAFWAIDADKIDKPAHIGTFFSTELKIVNPRKIQEELYQKDEHFNKWFDPHFRTAGNINAPNSPGCGQIMMSGRFTLYYHYYDTLLSHLGEIKKELSNPATAEVHVISSMFGGTGAGMYIDMGYMLQEQVSSDVYFHLLYPTFLEVWDSSGSQKYAWNEAYASLLELDFFASMNADRPASQQFQMKYFGGSEIKKYSYSPAKVVLLYGGYDQLGKSLMALSKGGNLFDPYTEFIANILFAFVAHKDFQAHIKKNVLDNVEPDAPDPSGHYKRFISAGYFALKFPEEKVKRYVICKTGNDFLFPYFCLPKADIGIIGEWVKKFCQTNKISEKEDGQLTKMIKGIKAYQGLQNNLKTHKKQILLADEKEKIPSVQVRLNFDDFQTGLQASLQSIRFGKSVNNSGRNKFQKQLEEFIFEKLRNSAESDEYCFKDIYIFLNQLAARLQKEVACYKKEHDAQHQNYLKNDFEKDFEYLYNVLRKTKESFFDFGNKTFRQNRSRYLKVVDDYFKAKTTLIICPAVMELWEGLIADVQFWIHVMEFIIHRVEEIFKNRERDLASAFENLRQSVFIYDETISGRGERYLYELHVGDSVSIVEKKIVKERVLPNIKNSKVTHENGVVEKKNNWNKIVKRMRIGGDRVPGIEKIIQEVESLTEIERNSTATQTEYQRKLANIFEKYFYSVVSNEVASIELADVLDWQFEAIHNRVKNAFTNKSSDREYYEETLGKMEVMFGQENAESLLSDVEELDYLNWCLKAKSSMLAAAAKNINALWRISGSESIVKHGAIIYPETLKINEFQRGLGKFAQNGTIATDLYNNKLEIYLFEVAINLNKLEDTFLNKLQTGYDAAKREKTKNKKHTPSHTDYRFYTDWEWDLEKDISEQINMKVLERFAIALVLLTREGQDKPKLIVRRKMKSGYKFDYSPPDGYKGREKKKLGDGLAKSVEKLNGDVELRDHFLNATQQRLSQIYYSTPAAKRDVVFRALLDEVHKNWQPLRPAFPEGRTPKSAGNPMSRSYYYWNIMNEYLTKLRKEVTNENLEELMLK